MVRFSSVVPEEICDRESSGGKKMDTRALTNCSCHITPEGKTRDQFIIFGEGSKMLGLLPEISRKMTSGQLLFCTLLHNTIIPVQYNGKYDLWYDISIMHILGVCLLVH